MGSSEVKSKSVAFEHFAFPFDSESRFLGQLDLLISQLGEELQAIAKAFRENLNGVTSVAWFPATTAIASVSSRLHIAESIRALINIDRDDPLHDEKASSIAHSRVAERLATSEGREEAASKVITELEHSLNSESFRVSAAEILRQAIVLAWASFEVFSSDIWVLLLNLRPTLSLELLHDERTKKWFQPKEMISVLKDYNFDISRNMGDIVVRWNRLDNLVAIREAFDAIMPTNEVLRTALHRDSLWLLSQRRNLIVHRRAIVDSQYLLNTGDAIEIGQELKISPSYLEASLIEVRDVGMEILKSSAALIGG